MNVLESTQNYIDLLSNRDAYLQDLVAKYNILADNYIASGTIKDMKISSDKISSLLSDNIVSLMMFLRMQGYLNDAMAHNPNLGRFLDGNNPNSVTKLVLSLKRSGWDIKQDESLADMTNTLKVWEIKDIGDLEGIDERDIFGEDTGEVIPPEKLEFNFDDDELGLDVPATVSNNPENKTTDQVINANTGSNNNGEVAAPSAIEDSHDVDEYDAEIHSEYYNSVKDLILSIWEDMYSKYVNGQEIVNGLLVPTGAIQADSGKKNEGILTLAHNTTTITPNMMANALFEEFIGACNDVGIPIVKTVEDNVNKVRPYKYNPLLQKLIASGKVDKEAFKNGWPAYSEKLIALLDKDIKALAVKKAKTGRDDSIYETLSGYAVSLLVINNKQGLGCQLRLCCGDTSKTEQFTQRFVDRVKSREKSHNSIAQGKLILGEAIISPSKKSSTISIYTNMQGYQAVPQFMGELLYNLSPGTFRPSIKNMIIGTDLNNEIITAPFTKWLLPIIAGSRSGKGVLTLNILLNVIGLGTPLFYLDCKPDMAALLWKLQHRYGIEHSMVVDGIGYKGITDIDRKPYLAPYAGALEAAITREDANKVLKTNYGVMVYLKTMLVILLANTYYKNEMGTQYGDIFVVFDEMYKVLVSQMTKLVSSIENAKAKLDKKENKAEINELDSIIVWINTLANDYVGNDIGVFGNGIKAVALTQFAMVESYKVQGMPAITMLCKNFILRRAVKLFGRQEGGSGMYGVGEGKSQITKDLYDKYFHFGIGSEQGNTYDTLQTFKPLLVLNENDSAEYKEYRVANHGMSAEELGGLGSDGAFVKDMMGRVKKYVPDVNSFRQKYFSGDPDLAGSVGFEGALDQIGRLLGVDWHEQLKLSFERAYDICDAALKYYNIIGGIENINSVEDFICDLSVKTLLSYDEITTAKISNRSLSAGAKDENSAFSNIPDGGVEATQTPMPRTADNDFEEDEDELEPFKQTSQNTPLSGYGTQHTDPIQSDEAAQRMAAVQELERQRLAQEEAQQVIQTGDKMDDLFGNNVQPAPIQTSEETAEQVQERIEREQAAREQAIRERAAAEARQQRANQILAGLGSPDLEKLIEEKGIENVLGQSYDADDYEAQPDIAPPRASQVIKQMGRKLVCTPDNIAKIYGLQKDNAVLASIQPYETSEKFGKRLFKTLWGTQYEFKNRWKVILNAVSGKINPSLVTRMLLTENIIAFNQTQVAAYNILGGDEDVRIEDIVDFNMTAKKFPNIKHIRIDEEIFAKAMVDYGDAIVGLFNSFKKLQLIEIVQGRSGGVINSVTRTELTQGQMSQQMQELQERTQFKQQMEVISAAKNPNLRTKSPGYQNRVWKSCKSMGGNSWRAASDAMMAKNPRLFKAATLGIAGAGIMAVGAVTGLFGKVFSLVKR